MKICQFRKLFLKFAYEMSELRNGVLHPHVYESEGKSDDAIASEYYTYPQTYSKGQYVDLSYPVQSAW